MKAEELKSNVYTCPEGELVKTDTDWFDEALTSHKSAAGLIIGDNGMELLILTEHEKVKDGDLKVRFYDYTEAAGTLKKYDSNTGLAVISVNLSDVDSSTREVISYAELGSSKSLRSGQPVQSEYLMSSSIVERASVRKLSQ